MFQGKTIVVTGAASGIGAAVARKLGSEGAHVIGVDVQEIPNDAVAQSFTADLSKSEDIDKLVADLPEGIDGLCNVAGVAPTLPPALVLQVNAMGLIRLTEMLICKMQKESAIVNLASLAGEAWRASVGLIKEFLLLKQPGDVQAFCDTHGIEGARSYFFSKEVVLAWTTQRCWAWKDKMIRMNAVSPGPVDTPLLPNFLTSLGERAAQAMAVQRSGTAEEVAEVVIFLLSPASRWMAGANLHVDGGLNAARACKELGL